MIFRHDDFFRAITLATVKWVHEEFLKRGLVETACIQVCYGNIPGLLPGVVEYLNDTPNYDIQLHCWNHDRYDTWDTESIIRDLSAAMSYIKETFGRYPTAFYPPFNAVSESVTAASAFLGLDLRNVGTYIKHYINAPAAYKDTPAIFFHSWSKDNLEALPVLLNLFVSEEA